MSTKRKSTEQSHKHLIEIKLHNKLKRIKVEKQAMLLDQIKMK
jgi:hypothetical protein